MKVSEFKKLKKGTPIKFVYRKFPYIGCFHSIVKDGVYMNWYMRCGNQYVEFEENDIRYVQAIEGITEFKTR